MILIIMSGFYFHGSISKVINCLFHVINAANKTSMPKPITVLCWHVIKKIWTEKRMIHISDKCPLGYE